MRFNLATVLDFIYNTFLILLISAALGFCVLYVHVQFHTLRMQNEAIKGSLSELYDNDVALYNKLSEEEEVQKDLKASLSRPTYQYLKNVTVFIVNREVGNDDKAWLGTGVVVKVAENATYILTNRHVCNDDLTHQCIIYEKDAAYLATVVKVSKSEFDMALLKVDTAIPNKEAVKGIATASIQEPVYMVGHNQARPFVYAEGVIAGYDFQNNKSLLVDISAAPGNSGSGIINKKGELVGLLWGGTITGEEPYMAPDLTHALCVDGRVLKLFLLELKP